MLTPSLGSQSGNPGLVSVIMCLGFSSKHKTSLLKNSLISLRSSGISRGGNEISKRSVCYNKPSQFIDEEMILTVVLSLILCSDGDLL